MDPFRRLITQQAGARQDTKRGTVIAVNQKNQTAHVRVREPIVIQNFIIRGESTLQEPAFTGSDTIILRVIDGFSIGDRIVIDPGLTTEEQFTIQNIIQTPAVDDTIQPTLSYLRNLVQLSDRLSFPHGDSAQVISNRSGDRQRPEFTWDPATQSFEDLSRTTIIDQETGQVIDELQYNILRDVPITPSSGSTAYVFPGAPVLLGFPGGNRQEFSIIAPSIIQQNPNSTPNNPSISRNSSNDTKLHVYLSPPREITINGSKQFAANPRRVDQPTIRVTPVDLLPAMTSIYAVDFEIAGDPQVIEELITKGGFKWRIFTVDYGNTQTFKILHRDDLTTLKALTPLYANTTPPLETNVTWGVKAYIDKNSPITTAMNQLSLDVKTLYLDGNPANGLYITTATKFTVVLQYFGPDMGGRGKCDVIIGAHVCTVGNPDGLRDPVLDARVFTTLRFSEERDVELRATFSPLDSQSGLVEDPMNEDWNWEPGVLGPVLSFFAFVPNYRSRSQHAVSNQGGALDLYVTERDLMAKTLPHEPAKRTLPRSRRFEYIYVYAEKLAVNNETELNNAEGFFRNQAALYSVLTNTDTSGPNGVSNLLYNNLFNEGSESRGRFWQNYYPLGTTGTDPIDLSLVLPWDRSSPSKGALQYADGQYRMKIQFDYSTTDKLTVKILKGIEDCPIPAGTIIRHSTSGTTTTLTSIAELDASPTITVTDASTFNIGDILLIGEGTSQRPTNYTITAKDDNTLTLSWPYSEHWGVLIVRPVYLVAQGGQYFLQNGNQCIIPLKP